MNKPVNTHETDELLVTMLNEEEVRVQSLLPINERTQSQQKSIDDIDGHILHATEQEEDPNVDVDTVPPPFQYPPVPNIRFRIYHTSTFTMLNAILIGM